MGATMCLTACGKSEAPEHDHVWNDGEITTESTCQKEGVKTYTCTVEGCGQTKTEPVGKKEHSWDSGEVTTPAKCDAEGEKTYKCTNEGCTATKTEHIDKIAHSWKDGEIIKAPDFLNKGSMQRVCGECQTATTVELPAAAGFGAQFYGDLAEANNWQYGYASTYDPQTGDVDFVRLTEVSGGVWKNGDIEISKGRILSGGESKAVVAYTFTEPLTQKMQTNVEISFTGDEANTALNAHLMAKDATGALKTFELNSAGKKDWTYKTEEPIDIARNVTVWLVFENVGQGKAGGALSVTLTAPCVHVWNDGSVKTPATCQATGVMEYSCLNCSAKYEGEIQKAPHNWDSGVVEDKPTETKEGLKKFTCQNEGCNETKTEKIPKLAPSTFSGADFTDDFSLTSQPNWKYGYTDNYNYGSNTFTFKEGSPLEDKWTDNKDIEIKSDWVRTETEGADIVIRYIMPETREINIALTFSGTNDNTRVAGRLLIQKPDGSLADDGYKFVDGCTASKDWSYTLNGVTVEKGNFTSVVLHNEGTGYGQGHFSMKLTATGAAPTETEIANFANDFELTEDGLFNGWEVGTINFHFPDQDPEHPETFDFTKITGHNTGNDGYYNADPETEIKAGSLKANGMIGFAYHFSAADKVTVNFTINGAENSKWSIRWGLKDENGAIKTNDGKASWGGDGKDVTLTQTLDVAAGDVFYVLVNKESDVTEATFTFTITGKAAQQPEPENVITNFNEDFAGTLAGTSNWEVGVVDYKFPEETFTFTKITNKNDGGDAFTDNTGENWKEIKGDWAAINGMVAFKYTFDNAVNAHVNFQIKGTGSNQYNIRWAITDSEGNVKNDGNKPAWVDGGNDVTLDTDVTAAAGDIFYIFIERNADIDGDQCTYSLVITGEKAQQPSTSTVVSDFHDDFHDNTVTESNWEYGSADYGWDGNHSIKANDGNTESFDYIKSETYDSANGAWTADGVEIKADWIKFEKNAVILYKAPAGGEADFHITFKGEDGKNTWSAVRIIITDGNNNFKGREEIWDGKNASQYDKTFSKTLAAGDKVYFIFFSEGTNDSGVATDNNYGHLTLTVTYKAA